MLQPGRSYKVKVEMEPGKVGYGRATVVEKTGNRVVIQVRTSKESNQVLPRGSRLWFVSDSPATTLNGLWSTTVVGTRIVRGHAAMECGTLKFEPLAHRRRSQRVPLAVPVRLAGKQLPYEVRSRNISRSGIGLEACSQYVDEFPVGEDVDIVLDTPLAAVQIKCRIIRTEYNWFANRTEIGLQFLEMSQDAIETLEQLRSTADQTATESGDQPGNLRTTLSGSLRTTRENLRLTRTGGELVQPSDDGDKRGRRRDNQKS